MVQIKELGYLGFEVSDLPRWQAFVTEVLGAAVAPGPADTLQVRVDQAPARLILAQGPANDCVFTGWRVADVAALHSFGQHLQANAVPYQQGTEAECAVRHATHMLHFTDPEGNRHEVYVARPNVLPPFSSAVVPAGFVTGAGGAGHVVYAASNYPAMIAFCQRVLGVALSDNIYVQPVPGVKVEVAFFHANERHHSLAVAPRSPEPGPRKQIHHFMLEVANLGDVGRARDRCLRFGLPVVMDIGQHPNDQMISFYAHTPSGFLVEVGWGGVKVDPTQWQAGAYDCVSQWGHRPYGAMPGTTPDLPAPVVEVA